MTSMNHDAKQASNRIRYSLRSLKTRHNWLLPSHTLIISFFPLKLIGQPSTEYFLKRMLVFLLANLAASFGKST
jgi:hypothetical protein